MTKHTTHGKVVSEHDVAAQVRSKLHAQGNLLTAASDAATLLSFLTTETNAPSLVHQTQSSTEASPISSQKLSAAAHFQLHANSQSHHNTPYAAAGWNSRSHPQ
jgi:hypothetical protein